MEAARRVSQAEGENEDEDMDEGEERVRDENFWFEDRTVVLVAEGRVPGLPGPFADQSPVLRDLFSQGEEEEEEDGEEDAGSNVTCLWGRGARNPEHRSKPDSGVHSGAGSDANSNATSDSSCPVIKLADSAGDLHHILRVFLLNRDPACVVVTLCVICA